MKEFPLGVAWRVLVRRPYLCLIPLAWDLVKWGLGAVLTQAGYYFSRWDFAVGWEYQGAGWHARFVLPAGLPSTEQLGLVLSPGAPAVPTWPQFAVMALVLVLDSLVKGGFLHLLNGALHGKAPSLLRMREGALRYGWRLLAIALVWMGYYTGVSALVDKGSLSPAFKLALNIVVIGLLAVAEFVVIAEDVWPPAGILGAPFVLWQELGSILAVVTAAGVLSALLTAATSWLGINVVPVLAPLYAATGTWAAAGALYAVASDATIAEEVSGHTADEAG